METITFRVDVALSWVGTNGMAGVSNRSGSIVPTSVYFTLLGGASLVADAPCFLAALFAAFFSPLVRGRRGMLAAVGRVFVNSPLIPLKCSTV